MAANDSQRYQAVERMLRQGGGAPRVPASLANCVDGETLAAWRSGALPATDAARVETHLADCDRCQAMLAAFARMEPEVTESVGAVVVPFWKRGHARWLVPLATAATVAAVWVAIPNRQQRVEDTVQLRESRPAPPPSPEAAASSARRLVLPDQSTANPTTQSAAPTRQMDTALRKEVSARERDETRGAASGAAGQQGRIEDRIERRADQQTAQANPLTTPAAPPAPSPPVPAPSVAPAERPAAATPVAGAAGAAQPPSALNESVAIARDSLAARVAGVEFASPDGATGWRVVNGRVERSTTRGKSWDVVALPSAAGVTAGHAPSASVAWFVGRNGMVFSTADGGARFERIPFPHATDLVAVTATDARQATVRAADGRTFRTADSGATWNLSNPP